MSVFDFLQEETFPVDASQPALVADGESPVAAQPVAGDGEQLLPSVDNRVAGVDGIGLLPVPVLADSEPRKTEVESSEARESTQPTGECRADSRGGHNAFSTTLSKVASYLTRYVNFTSESQAIACALWVAHTWVFERFRYTPYLHIFSPEKRCGKSILIDALALVVARPWKIDNLSEATLFHRADAHKPTMLWDEVDNVFVNEKDNRPIIGLLNAGFKKGGLAARMPRGTYTEYNVYCPKALGGIGRIPDTTHDRCIDIRLARAKPSQVFREEEAEAQASVIRAELVNFVTALAPDAHKIKVKFPSEYAETDGRRCDITEPLLILASLAGEEWFDRATYALGDLCSNVDDLSVGIQLLKDCYTIFANRNAYKLSTTTLLNDLIQVEDADSPWPVWWEGDVKFGKPGGPAKKLATLLKGYRITPHVLRIDQELVRGYIKADFEDAWTRYVPKPPRAETAELELDL